MTDWIDVTDMARQNILDPVIGREQEIERVIEVLLRRTKNNPLLVGAAGVGKTAIVEGLAQRIAQGAVPQPLLQTQIYTFDLGLVMAEARSRGTTEKLEELFVQALGERPQPPGDAEQSQSQQRTNAILFVDELHLLSTRAVDGVAGMLSLLRLALARGAVTIIAETTPEHYHQYQSEPSDLHRFFHPIPIEEPSVEETAVMLRGIAPRFAAFHHVVVTEEALQAAAILAKRHFPQRALPDPAVDLLDEAAGRIRARHQASQHLEEQRMSEADIVEVVSLWSGLPLMPTTP